MIKVFWFQLTLCKPYPDYKVETIVVYMETIYLRDTPLQFSIQVYCLLHWTINKVSIPQNRKFSICINLSVKGPNVETTDDVYQMKFMLTSQTMTLHNSWQFAYFFFWLSAHVEATVHGFVLSFRYERTVG